MSISINKNKMDWNNWLKSQEGIDSNDFYSLTEQQYLTNRLWWAFKAGQEYASQEVAETKKEIDRLTDLLIRHEDYSKELKEKDDLIEIHFQGTKMLTKLVEEKDEKIKELEAEVKYLKEAYQDAPKHHSGIGGYGQGV